jgi:aspartyl protease family protein
MDQFAAFGLTRWSPNEKSKVAVKPDFQPPMQCWPFQIESAMRQILILAAVVMAGGVYAARYADRAVDAHPPPQVATIEPVSEPLQSASSGRSLMLESDNRGHFRVEGRIDGRRVDFLVDTGASLVILRESDAAEVGIRPMPRDYTATAVTANGKIKGAPTTIERIELGDITVYDVRAMVLPDEALSQSLLGVSFLSKLRRYEYANGRMVLEQ